MRLLLEDAAAFLSRVVRSSRESSETAKLAAGLLERVTAAVAACSTFESEAPLRIPDELVRRGRAAALRCFCPRCNWVGTSDDAPVGAALLICHSCHVPLQVGNPRRLALADHPDFADHYARRAGGVA
jgi:hypothetical protein